MAKPVSHAPNLDDVDSFTVSGVPGGFVYKEGDTGKDMFIIQEGSIEILSLQAGESRSIDVLKPGDFFGELSLFGDQRRDTSARGVTQYRLIRIDRTTLHQLVQENPDIAVRMLYRLASRLREHEDARRRAWEIAAGAMNPMPAPHEDANPPSLRIPAPPMPPPPVAVPPAMMPTILAPAVHAPSASPAPAAAPAVPRFVHVGSGEEFPLRGNGPLIIGRNDRASGFTPEVDLKLLDDERRLSRRHASITRRDDGWHLSEPKATGNGTFVNDARIAPGVDVRLSDGDRVRFGPVETTFHER